MISIQVDNISKAIKTNQQAKWKKLSIEKNLAQKWERWEAPICKMDTKLRGYQITKRRKKINAKHKLINTTITN